MFLKQLGWCAFFAKAFESRPAGQIPGRVSGAGRERFRVWTEGGEIEAALAGGERRAGHEAWPVTGDWVALEGALIEGVLPRRTRIVRRAAGNVPAPQVLAANVDVVFVVTGLDGDFNPRRIERYLCLAHQGGAAPVVVLNKSDLVRDTGAFTARVRASAPETPVVAGSALTGAGVEALKEFFEPGQTAAFLGSSGAGKSTIINRLLGEERHATAEVREGDSRGRHTTTGRQLTLLPCGRILMDLPGLREVQLWAGEDGLERTFEDIAALGRECRFRDCRHTVEPGCAVRAAIETGTIEAARLGNYSKMKRELDQLELRTGGAAALAERRRWKAIHKAARQLGKRR